MPHCPRCGQNLDPQAQFCSRCGQRLTQPAPETGLPAGIEKVINVLDFDTDSFFRRHWVAFTAMILIATGAFIFGVFYFVGKSEPAELTLEVLRSSPAAREALGEIRDVGWPSGGMRTSGGGVGSANFEVSVEGSKAKGVFYASLYKRLGKWRFESGTLLLDNGRNVAVPPP